MKRNSIILYLILVFLNTEPVFSQDMQRVRKTIDTLCSKKMQGRGYLKEGDKQAADYLKNEFEKIGLKNFKNNYFQYFVFDVNTFPDRVKLRIDRKKLTKGKDFIANSISQSGEGKGKIFKLNKQLFEDSIYQAKFLKSRKIRRRVIVFETKDYPYLIALPQKLLDKVYSAKALIELKENKLTASLSNRQLSNPLFELLKEKFDTLARKARFALDTELLVNYLSQNVIGYVEGSLQADSFIVFSAHYDHLGLLGKKVYFPGANDNASGVSMLLELAHHYAKPENKPKYSIVFMAFSAEEVGLVGSKHYVQHPLFPLLSIKFLINVDLVGTGDEGATVVNGTVFKPEFEKLLKINTEKKYLPALKVRGFAANSDHYYFTENGVKSFFLYTLGGIQAYHDIYDRPETLPLTKYKEVFNLIKDFIAQF